LIGADIFNNFIVEIDYEKKKITFHKVESYKYKKKTRAKETLPLIIHNSKPYIEADVYLENEVTPKKVKLLLDLGSSDALWLFPGSLEGYELPEKTYDTFLGVGLNGEIFGKKGRISKIAIGKYELKNPIVSFPDSSSIRNSADQELQGRNGSIGAEILSRFNIIIDYKNQLLTLEPNNKFRHSFNHNMSGVEIHTPYVGLPVFEISYVREGSPGYQAGLKKGDQILSINYKNAVDYTLNDIILLFQQREKKKIKMKVLRDGVTIKTKFTLQKAI
jgi:hypothetical protein